MHSQKPNKKVKCKLCLWETDDELRTGVHSGVDGMDRLRRHMAAAHPDYMQRLNRWLTIHSYHAVGEG